MSKSVFRIRHKTRLLKWYTFDEAPVELSGRLEVRCRKSPTVKQGPSTYVGRSNNKYVNYKEACFSEILKLFFEELLWKQNPRSFKKACLSQQFVESWCRMPSGSLLSSFDPCMSPTHVGRKRIDGQKQLPAALKGSSTNRQRSSTGRRTVCRWKKVKKRAARPTPRLQSRVCAIHRAISGDTEAPSKLADYTQYATMSDKDRWPYRETLMDY